MGKPKCKMTLKDLLTYLDSLQEGPGPQDVPGFHIVEERVFIRGKGAHTMVLDIEAMKQIVHSCRTKAVCAN